MGFVLLLLFVIAIVGTGGFLAYTAMQQAHDRAVKQTELELSRQLMLNMSIAQETLETEESLQSVLNQAKELSSDVGTSRRAG